MCIYAYVFVCIYICVYVYVHVYVYVYLGVYRPDRGGRGRGCCSARLSAPAARRPLGPSCGLGFGVQGLLLQIQGERFMV